MKKEVRDKLILQILNENGFIDIGEIERQCSVSAIAKLAARFVKDNESILIDSGTTVFRLCNFIHKRLNLQVVTSSLSVASELIKWGRGYPG